MSTARSPPVRRRVLHESAAPPKPPNAVLFGSRSPATTDQAYLLSITQIRFFLSFSKGGKKGVIIYCKKYATLIPSNLSQKKVGDFFLILSGTYTIVPTVLPASPYIESEAAGRKSDYAQQEQQHEQQRSSSSSADRKWGRATGASGQESRVYRMNTTAVLVVVNINSVGITAYTRLR